MKNNPFFHGLALVKKPAGLTSHDVVAKARYVFQTPSVGHCGTLDPMATGLLILLVGEATKLSQYILEGNKSYRVGVLFGQETDTLDITGEVLRSSDEQPTVEMIKAQADQMTGAFQWPIPMYSAKKVGGKKLYELARDGETIEVPTKEMRFWGVQMIEADETQRRAVFDISCSKGSFIRTWVDQLGKSLKCGATMSSLQRTGSVPYELSQAHTLEEISEGLANHLPLPGLIRLENALSSSKKVRIKGLDAHLFKNGQISFDLRGRLIQAFNPKQDQYVFIVSQETKRPMGVVGIDPGKGFTIRRVFNC